MKCNNEDDECDTSGKKKEEEIIDLHCLAANAFHIANRMLYLYFTWDRSWNEIITIVLRFRQNERRIRIMQIYM